MGDIIIKNRLNFIADKVFYIELYSQLYDLLGKKLYAYQSSVNYGLYDISIN
jgi:hypothetical protein